MIIFEFKSVELRLFLCNVYLLSEYQRDVYQGGSALKDTENIPEKVHLRSKLSISTQERGLICSYSHEHKPCVTSGSIYT